MNNLETILAALAASNQPAGTPQQPAGTPISGPIIGLANGAKLGDCRVRAVPAGIKWVRKVGKDGRPYVRSATICNAVAHVGEHGGAWATDVTDSGVPYVETAAVSTFDLNGALKEAAVDAADAPAATSTPAEDAPTV